MNLFQQVAARILALPYTDSEKLELLRQIIPFSDNDKLLIAAIESIFPEDYNQEDTSQT